MLRAGDVLLVQGSREAIESLRDSGKMLVLDGAKDLPQKHKSKRALFILGSVILSAALGLMPISVSALLGVGFLLLTELYFLDRCGTSPFYENYYDYRCELGAGKALVATDMASYLGIFICLCCGRAANTNNIEYFYVDYVDHDEHSLK